jgi:hypothetical protein
MKKLVSVLFALLLVGSFAFAEVNVGAWGRLLVAPAASLDGGDNFAFAGPDWGGRQNVGFAVGASNDHVGFALDVDYNGGNIGFGDQAKSWIKVNEMFTVQMGMIQGDVLRGKVDDSGFLNAIKGITLVEDDALTTDVDESVVAPMVQGTTGKDDIFKRFYPATGMLFDITPAEGIYIGAAIDTTQDAGILTEDMFKKIQIGAGYVIADVGHIRAQYIGNVDDAAKYLNVAFAYTAMEGVLVDAGLKYQTEDKAGKSTVAVSATYGADALSAVLRTMVGFGESGENDELLIQASADLGYVVADPLALGAEVSYKKEGDPTGLTVAPYAKLGYAGGFLKAAFAFSSFTETAGGDYTAWSIPIMVQYGF